MPLVSEDHELFTLRNAARPLGYWVGLHRNFDAARGGGPFYVMHAKSSPRYEQHWNDPTVLKYATAEQVEDFLKQEGENYAA
jgi:hypothetical protein